MRRVLAAGDAVAFDGAGNESHAQLSASAVAAGVRAAPVLVGLKTWRLAVHAANVPMLRRQARGAAAAGWHVLLGDAEGVARACAMKGTVLFGRRIDVRPHQRRDAVAGGSHAREHTPQRA